MSGHSLDTVTIKHYPGSSYAESVAWRCKCGKTGKVSDGAYHGASVARAKSAWRSHANGAKP